MSNNPNLVPKGTIFSKRKGALGLDHSYVILLEDMEPDSRGMAEEFWMSMSAFGGLPGCEYRKIPIHLYSEDHITPDKSKSRRLTDSELEELAKKDEFVTMASKIISEHGDNWNTKEYWEGTGMWND